MTRSQERRARKKGRASPSLPLSWFDSAGLHALVPGSAPSPDALAQATKLYQQEIRNSPLWHEMVEQFGREEAERILLQFRVEVG